jgi:hypothetical protein
MKTDNPNYLGKVACELVIIEWVDSRRPDAAWRHLSGDQEWEVCKCVSVGFMVADDQEKKVLAPNMADIDSASNMQFAGEIVIPTACVVSITRLIEITAS